MRADSDTQTRTANTTLLQTVTFVDDGGRPLSLNANDVEREDIQYVAKQLVDVVVRR